MRMGAFLPLGRVVCVESVLIDIVVIIVVKAIETAGGVHIESCPLRPVRDDPVSFLSFTAINESECVSAQAFCDRV